MFVHFPEEETGKKCKMSRPRYGPFRVVARKDLGVSKVYFPEDATLLVHQLRVCPSPAMLPAGFYWYGAKRCSTGCTPNWLRSSASSDQTAPSDDQTTPSGDQTAAGEGQTAPGGDRTTPGGTRQLWEITGLLV